MGERDSDKTKALIKKLIQEGLSTKEIAREAGVHVTTARIYRRIAKGEFASYIGYYDYLAQRDGFNSRFERRKYITKKRSQPSEKSELGKMIYERLNEFGKSLSNLAEEVNVTERIMRLYLQGKRFPSRERLEKILEILYVKEVRYGTEENKALEEKAKREDYEREEQRKDRVGLAALIGKYLTNSGKSQRELAEELGLDPSTITLYVQGKRSPRQKTYEKMREFLQSPKRVYRVKD